MPIEYNAKDADGCWPEDDYEVELLQVLDKTSQTSGNAMQEWKVKAYHPDGRTQTISDYFVPPGGTFKLKQLALALGKKQEFEEGVFQADDYEGATMFARLCIEEGKDGYPDRNKVKKYLPKVEAAPKRPAPTTQGTSIKQQIMARQKPVTNPVSQTQEFAPDDIPF